MAGALTPSNLDAAKDENGTTFREAAAAVGYDAHSTQGSISPAAAATH